MELISVIVPVYKVEAYLDRCVQSIVDQTYKNLEVILVDDGSPDNCPAMCDAWAEKDSRIRVIHKKNGGLSDARNAGLSIAQGEWISFVDSDDWVDTEFLDLMYRGAKENNAEISACDVLITSSEALRAVRMQKLTRVCTSTQALSELLSGKGFRAVAWNKLYRKEVLINERFPIGRYHEDEFFTYRIIAKTSTLVYIDKPLYFYFQRPGSIMNSFSPKRLDVLDAYWERLNYLKANNPDLYVKDKLTYCQACIGLYRDVLKQKGFDSKAMKHRIKNSRKRIRFTAREWGNYSVKQLIYIWGSGIGIDLFCTILNMRKSEEENV